ncbi:MAG: hypothetical protein WCK18_03345 [Prolixibacteraceae bacterium]|jgi:hypothetical protein
MNNSKDFYFWLPRVICIAAILFVSMFALDSFGPGLTIWQQILGFLIHLIPSYVLIALLVVAWKWEYVGGLLYIVLGLIFSVFIFNINFVRNQFSFGQSLFNALIIAFPFVVAGYLFILSNKRKKKAGQQ